MMDYWTRFSKSGVNGDTIVATCEKGRIIFEAVAPNFVHLAREFKIWPLGERSNITRPSGRAETCRAESFDYGNATIPVQNKFRPPLVS